MKPGDKIVCINTDKFITWDGLHKEKVLRIKENTIYTVYGRGPNYDIQLYEIDGTFYHSERFITLERYRKIKINKITNGKIKKN